MTKRTHVPRRSCFDKDTARFSDKDAIKFSDEEEDDDDDDEEYDDEEDDDDNEEDDDYDERWDNDEVDSELMMAAPSA